MQSFPQFHVCLKPVLYICFLFFLIRKQSSLPVFSFPSPSFQSTYQCSQSNPFAVVSWLRISSGPSQSWRSTLSACLVVTWRWNRSQIAQYCLPCHRWAASTCRKQRLTLRYIKLSAWWHDIEVANRLNGTPCQVIGGQSRPTENKGLHWYTWCPMLILSTIIYYYKSTYFDWLTDENLQQHNFQLHDSNFWVRY